MQMTKIQAAAEVGVEIVAPLSKCRIAPENIRQDALEHVDDELVELAASIETKVGLIQRPVAYEEDGKFYFTAGGRRLRALVYLKAQKRLPDVFKAGVPITLCDKMDAVEISIAENNIRKAASQAEEFRGFRALAGKGLAPIDIARMTGNSERQVARMLRLAQVAPAVLDAYDRQEIDLDVLRVFSVSTDHARQEEILAAGLTNAHQVRAAITSGATRSTDFRAQIVTVEAYQAAGGRVDADLFSDHSYLLDEELLESLYAAKVDAELDRLRSEGWGEVIASDDWSIPRGYQAHYTPKRPFTEAEQEELDRADDILNREDATEAEVSAASDTIDRLNDLARLPAVEDRGNLACFLHCRSASFQTSIARAVSAPTVSGSKSLDVPFGHTGHERMTRIATVAVRNGLALDPAAALDCLVSHQAWTCLRSKTLSTSYALPSARPANIECEGIALKGDVRFLELYEHWDNVLPKDAATFSQFVQALSQDEKLALLALCTSLQINGLETRADSRRTAAWAQIGEFANRIDLRVSEQWVPSEEFLSNANRASLLAAIKDMGGDPEAHAKDKKGALVEITAKMAKLKNWVPSMLASLGQAVPSKQ